MGQCTSRKAAGAFAATAAVSHNRPGKMHKHQQLKNTDDENNKKATTTDSGGGVSGPAGGGAKNKHAYTKGVAMSFGFKKRAPSTASIGNATAARRLANTDDRDRNGNNNPPSEDTALLASSAAPPGRSTPRLAPPKKEAVATRVSRFGFRQNNQANRINKVADLNSQTIEFGYKSRLVSPTGECPANNNLRKPTNTPIVRNVTVTDNRNAMAVARLKMDTPSAQIGRYTMQSTQLPRPEPIRVIETKTAKTLANNNKRSASMFRHYEDNSSKDGSLTEDSGVGSHISGYLVEEGHQELERLESSPAFGAYRRVSSNHLNQQHQRRALEMVPTGNHTFDVRDLEDSSQSNSNTVPPPPLPELPSAFGSNDNKRSAYQNTGIVRERTIDYNRSLNWDNRGRKMSITSSDGFSDDYGEEEKTYKDRFRSEKTFVKSTSHTTFLKSRFTQLREADSSPPSSDEQDWAHGGEGMADDTSFSITSSSDESNKQRGREKEKEQPIPISAAVVSTALHSFMSDSLSSSASMPSTKDVKNVLLTIEDPKFAAVAAASNSGSLLDDELLSPVESLISCSESEELKRRSSSNSKDVNEKETPPTPGTPTHASNSLSLSDGKDDFLIDDEIADQPALVFEDTVIKETFNNTSQNNSEATPTIVDTTPAVPRWKGQNTFEGSPLSIRNKRFLHSRTGSLDTLSPCESIASDDLMMDYDMSSGVEDCDRQSFPSLNETALSKTELDHTKVAKDWPYHSHSHEKFLRSAGPGRTRLLNSRSRTATPTSVPDSPRSLDSRPSLRFHRPTSTSSPIKARLSSSGMGYDSDEGNSVRLDRTQYAAVKQDIMGFKAMLLKLRRVLNEQKEEDLLLRSDTHNPFESQVLTNGLFNSLSASDSNAQGSEENLNDARLELADLRRQVLFLQGQLEDKEKTVQNLQEQMVKLISEDYHAKSAPASVASDQNTCNAATQTERCE